MILKGRIFDGLELSKNSTIVIGESGTIEDIGERGSVEEKSDSKVIEVKDGTILPGLIDAHVHFFGAKGSGITEWAMTPDALAVLRSVADLNRLLRAGFTSVRELGTKAGTMLAKAANEDCFPSPRIVSCSRALAQTGGDDDPTALPLEIGQKLASYSYFCDGPWDCRRAVRKVVRDGGTVVKIYASGAFSQGGKVRLQFTLDEIEAIVDEAHRSGLKVAAHAYGEEALINVVKSGVDSIEHGLGLTEEIAKMIGDKRIYYVPTLITYRKLKPSSNPAREEMIKSHFAKDMILAKEYSLLVTMGSDIVGDETRPHGMNYEEILEEARFLGNKEALIAATSRAAECIDLEKTGKLTKGSVADVIVVRGNPLENLSALAPESIIHVIKQGKLYSNA
ncbi:MAG: metal-dependent hydrolase family protein [Nitrososphaerales archaeon]